MGTGKAEMAQFAPFISELTQKGCRDEVLKLAKEDLELGYPQELVALYAEAGWQMDRCKKFSSIMRADSDGELLRMLAEGGFNQYQMQLLANYYEKGLAVPQLADVGAKGLTAYDMERTLKLVYQENKEAEAVRDSSGAEEKTPQEPEASMLEALRPREKELEEQQDTNNRQAAENAALRTKLEGLEKQAKELEQEKAGYDNEKRSILEERDRFYRQSQTLLEEKSQLIADIEEVQKEKDGLEKRLKEMEERKMAEAATEQAAAGPHMPETQQTVGSRQLSERQQTTGSRQPGAEQKNKNSGDMGNHDIIATVKGRNGETHLIPVERTARRKPDGLKAFAERFLGRGRQSSGLIKQLAGKGLNPAQMEQIRIAVQAGLTEQEVNDLIGSGYSADEMAQAVGIVLAERNYR